MKSRGSTTDIIKWKDLDSGEVRQCMDATTASDYETLCGFALQDTVYEGGAVIIEYRRGRVTCPHCLAVIDAVLNG